MDWLVKFSRFQLPRVWNLLWWEKSDEIKNVEYEDTLTSTKSSQPFFFVGSIKTISLCVTSSHHTLDLEDCRSVIGVNFVQDVNYYFIRYSFLSSWIKSRAKTQSWVGKRWSRTVMTLEVIFRLYYRKY